MRALALVLAAGQGVRLGREVPKGFVRLRGRTLLAWSAAALARAPEVAAVLCVLPADGSAGLDSLRESFTGPAELLPAATGGARRQDSVARGLEAGRRARPDLDWVLVHDAARCLVEPADASAVLAAARATGAALPVLPASDTVKWLDGDRVERTLERARVGLAQTPQAFRVEVLREALEKAERDGVEGTDCASLVERLGVEVRTSRGRAENFKVTHPEDLARAEALLAARGGG
ncbi:MAG TPA: 2-C-methyl-D-erythritol 4-phosphate cytidylyltransferase [Myxococcota bacterium]|nr:2-C-methyl-D-erythritol 4-phosphate cytidylyltransferase [Myxococcota bacterium]